MAEVLHHEGRHENMGTCSEPPTRYMKPMASVACV